MFFYYILLKITIYIWVPIGTHDNTIQSYFVQITLNYEILGFSFDSTFIFFYIIGTFYTTFI